MQVRENESFTADYYDRSKRFIGNAVQVFFRDGSATQRVVVDYPVGHPRRREEGAPLLKRKFERAVTAHFDEAQAEDILQLFDSAEALDEIDISQLMTVLAVP
jgi:2-methylcitrate dehydratase